MNLVLIGHFKQAQDASKTLSEIKALKDQARKDDVEFGILTPPEDHRFSNAMMELFRTLQIYNLGPNEIGQLLSEHDIEESGPKLTLTTEESEISAFVKLFIEAGAKVEIFSRHDYPGEPADTNGPEKMR
nr:DUF6375 family protein [uncultured Albidiferax sp.]